MENLKDKIWREKCVQLWELRLSQIEELGNCKNSHGAPFFSPNYKRHEMVAYCEKMIEAIKTDENL
jgi:hypothetical protein